ncbi:hypothetical protein WA026_014602 [Henosepilachna vigintioctopunctata]|uniref:Uncharacterized protein n=1 Tax=Henosepilachna vigintioctopunctata TaxID=420089 RepID=A0AAW1VGQ2_9CUCU
MFANNDEKKLDWMYKGPTALVNREDYLLGRTVDKTLDQLNSEEKSKLTNQLLAPPKNHVEHECIPPSIRDYNKIVQSEQVDLQAKLQEDPLVLIKRQEDETRRQFLQNPIQLKKLEEAMQAQMKENKKHRKDNDGLDRKLRKKLKKLNKTLKKKGGYKELKIVSVNDDIDEARLDTILMHKFNSLKSKLSEDDLKNILLGNFSENEDSEPEHKKEASYFKSLNLSKTKDFENLNDCTSSDSDKYNRTKKSESTSHTKHTIREKIYKRNKIYDSNKMKRDDNKKIRTRMSEEEKEILRNSMMQHAAKRNEECAKSYKKYNEEQSKSEKITHYGEEFMRKQFLKSVNYSSVADRIKANVNNIQRTESAMETNFLK